MITDTDKLIGSFIENHDVGELTKYNYNNMLHFWCNWLVVNGISWAEARKPHVIRFRDDLKSQGRSRLYINNFLSLLNKFYDYLQDSMLYPLNIAANVKKFPSYKGFRKNPLAFHQVERLLRSIDEDTPTGRRDLLIIKLMLFSGLRCVEVSRLDTEDIVFDPIPYMNVMGKGKSDKVKVGLADEVAVDLKKYMGRRFTKKNEPVFLVWEKAHLSDRMSAAYIGIMVKARMKDAGIDDRQISAHSLRHTCAVQLLKNNNSLYDVQVTLRHTTPNMTTNYLRSIEDERRFELRLSQQLATFYRTKQTEIIFKNNIQHSGKTV